MATDNAQMLALWLIAIGLVGALVSALYFRYRNQSDGQSIPSKTRISFYTTPHDDFGVLRLTLRPDIGPLVSTSILYLFALAAAISFFFFSSGSLSWLEILLIFVLFASILPAIFKRYQQSWNFYEWGILYKDGKKETKIPYSEIYYIESGWELEKPVEGKGVFAPVIEKTSAQNPEKGRWVYEISYLENEERKKAQIDGKIFYRIARMESVLTTDLQAVESVQPIE